MPNSLNRPLRVFLCHSSNDKPLVRELYQKLHTETWIQPWLDEEELYPGQDWDIEIEKAVEQTDAVIVFLSKNSVSKEGYVQAELRYVLDIARTKPEETIFVIPVRLEECQVPRRLMIYQYVDYFPKEQRDRTFQRLLTSLKRRADSLGLKTETPAPEKESKRSGKSIEEKGSAKDGAETGISGSVVDSNIIVGDHNTIIVEKPQPEPNQALDWLNDYYAKYAKPIEEWRTDRIELGGMEFMRVPAGKFLMGSTKENKLAYDDERPQHTVDIPYDYWMARFPTTNEQYSAFVKAKGLKHPVGDWAKKKDHPVAKVTWKDAMAYCQWLNGLLKGKLTSGLILRLPTEAEWEKAARGSPLLLGEGRGEVNEWPWGNQFDKNKCNSSEGGKGITTPVGLYSPQGDSPYLCADMAGNVWEWTHSLFKPYPYKADDGREDEKASGARVLRGGSFDGNRRLARCAYRYDLVIDGLGDSSGFRVVASPNLS